MVIPASAPIFDEDEIKLYYTDSNYEHGFTEKDFTKELVAPIWVVRCAQLKNERLSALILKRVNSPLIFQESNSTGFA
jgi:hypothetical protein